MSSHLEFVIDAHQASSSGLLQSKGIWNLMLMYPSELFEFRSCSKMDSICMSARRYDKGTFHSQLSSSQAKIITHERALKGAR